MEFIFSFRFLVFWLLAALCSHLAFREHPALETCLYARFLLDRFCAGYDSASQAGGGTEEPIYSQAFLLEPRHGHPPPPPQIALRFAAQIILEERAKIQAAALRAARVSQRRGYKGSAGTRPRNQPRTLSGLLDQSVDCRIEIATWGFFFRLRVCSSLRASVIDGSSFAATSST